MKVILILISIFIFVILSKIRIYADYKREGENDRVKFTIQYLKILKFSFTIPFVDIDKKDKEYGLKIKTKIFSADPDEGFIDLKTVIEEAKKFKHYYEIYTDTFDKITTRLKKGIVFEKFNTYMLIGLEDCAITAISIGLLYSILHSIYGFLDNKIRILQHEIIIEPYYNKFHFKINLNCIFKISIGNIIYVGSLAMYLFIIHKLQVLTNPKVKININ